jgi:hypothetical protein
VSRRSYSPRPERVTFDHTAAMNDQRSWWRRETPMPNYALVAFGVLVVNGLVQLVGDVVHLL